MSILITGSKGQLGSEIKAIHGQYQDVEFIFADIEELDITNLEAVLKFCSANTVTGIINCAAYTAVDKAEQERDLAYKINAVGPQNLAKYCEQSGARLIQISTDYVFDGTAHVPLKEDDRVNAIGAYGDTKLDGERFVLATNSDSIIIRTSWLYSTFGNNFVKTMRRLGGERSQLNVVWDQIGTPTNAADLARISLEIILDIDPISKNGRIYHFSNEGVASWYDFAHAIMEMSGLSCQVNPIESIDFPTPTKRPHYSVMNKAKIKEDFGIEILHWRESLKECINKL